MSTAAMSEVEEEVVMAERMSKEEVEGTMEN